MNALRVRIWSIIKWILFRLDAEVAHRFSVLLVRSGIRLRNIPLRIVSGVSRNEELFGTKGLESPGSQILGMEFSSRLGLAAGFDKNAEIVAGLPALGFGFVEIGTVTPRAQAGNARPRLFRDVAREALFNRMGFNGLGAALISERLLRIKSQLPANFRVGVNLGKNKDTPIDKSAEDYVRAGRPFEGLADYLVINVSSPNTPGLRSLQTVEALKPIVDGVATLVSGWKKRTPLLLKLAPELHGPDLLQLIQAVEPWGIDGWVLTNTLGGTFNTPTRTLDGGWSGSPLATLSTKSLTEARRATQKPIISVGGITTAEEAVARIRAGADLLQIYTGWVFRGPTFPAHLSREIEGESVRSMIRSGLTKAQNAKAPGNSLRLL